MTERQIFIDLDGVLADFISAAFVVHLSHYDPTTYPRMEWSIAKVLGITEDQFWQKIDAAEPNFWPKLSPYEWSEAIVAHAQASAERVAFLSTPSLHPSCHYGKRQWASKYFPKVELILCKSKELLAAPGRILIDDNDGNVTKWRKAGGIGILFPQPWNSNHQFCDDPYFGHVAEQLDHITDDAFDANPKDIEGRKKAALRLVPSALSIHVANVMKLGADKYGEYNWRTKPVKRTVYLEAAMRHILAAMDGADIDPESGSPHESHAAACMGIILDAMATGNLIDDRPTPGAASELMAEVSDY
jgi:5'(3')-deoxyribonucleotidase